MEITIGHSYHTSYENLLVQNACLNINMTWIVNKQGSHLLNWKHIYTYVQPSLLKQQKEKHKIFQIFCKWQECKIALFAWVPHMGLEPTFINEGDEVL